MHHNVSFTSCIISDFEISKHVSSTLVPCDDVLEVIEAFLVDISLQKKLCSPRFSDFEELKLSTHSFG